MSAGSTTQLPWSPPRDEDLTWFPAPKLLASYTRPLEFTLEVEAFCFGITRALESLEFPLTDIRPRLLDGFLYLAVAPSVQAEKDTARRLRSVQDLSYRYTKDIGGFWKQQVQSKIEGYNRWMAEFVNGRASSIELAEQVRRLRRVRGNQWFDVCRPVLAPTVIINRRLEDTRRTQGDKTVDTQSLLQAVEDGHRATREALAMLDSGKGIMFSSLGKIGARLTEAACLADPQDIFWLEWVEVRNTLEKNLDKQGVVVQRKAETRRPAEVVPRPAVGPRLAKDAPRMYLIPEIMDLLG